MYDEATSVAILGVEAVKSVGYVSFRSSVQHLLEEQQIRQIYLTEERRKYAVLVKRLAHNKYMFLKWVYGGFTYLSGAFKIDEEGKIFFLSQEVREAVDKHFKEAQQNGDTVS